MHSLTHAGRNVVQAGLQSAAALLGAVRDVRLQVGNAKLPLVHHANQAAAGLARALPCGGGQMDTARTRTGTGTDSEFTQRCKCVQYFKHDIQSNLNSNHETEHITGEIHL